MKTKPIPFDEFAVKMGLEGAQTACDKGMYKKWTNAFGIDMVNKVSQEMTESVEVSKQQTQTRSVQYTHAIRRTGPIHWCAVCGAYAISSPRSLYLHRSVCPGVSMGFKRRQRKRLLQGLHPASPESRLVPVAQFDAAWNAVPRHEALATSLHAFQSASVLWSS